MLEEEDLRERWRREGGRKKKSMGMPTVKKKKKLRWLRYREGNKSVEKRAVSLEG